MLTLEEKFDITLLLFRFPFIDIPEIDNIMDKYNKNFYESSSDEIEIYIRTKSGMKKMNNYINELIPYLKIPDMFKKIEKSLKDSFKLYCTPEEETKFEYILNTMLPIFITEY